MDNALTKQLQLWLQIERPSEEDIIAGAQLLLRIDRNRVLFQNICRKPQSLLPKLTHELRKHVRYRLDGLTLQEVRRMDSEVTALMEAKESGKDVADVRRDWRHGKRPDHDTLPDGIRQLWDTNAERWKRMKEAFATCQLLEMPCDRYEYLRLIKEGYQLYKRDMAIYDYYGTDKEQSIMTHERHRGIENARAYISKHLPKLESGEERLSDDLKARMQQRIRHLEEMAAPIQPEYIERLQMAGVID